MHVLPKIGIIFNEIYFIFMIHQIQQEEKERVVESIKEWIKCNIYEYETEEKFWNAFDEFIKTL